jgi:DNA-binding LytR/AlgR family response regulator
LEPIYSQLVFGFSIGLGSPLQAGLGRCWWTSSSRRERQNLPSGFGPFYNPLAQPSPSRLFVAIVITAVGQLAARKRTTSTPDTNHPPILDRLPPKFRNAEIYAISAEDHYVRVHSAVGEHMLLMRLTDAEAFAAPLKGIKPHRSWWVAEAGVESVKKSEGKLLIKLKTGTIVPVSREGGKRVRAAGWI